MVISSLNAALRLVAKVSEIVSAASSTSAHGWWWVFLLTGGFPRWPGDKPVPLLTAPPGPLRPFADGRVCSSAPRQGLARGPCPQEPHGRVRSCGLRRKRAGTGGICLGYRREKTVRACFTSALLLRREIAGLHTSTGTLIGHLPHIPPSAWCDCSPTRRLLSISKRDTPSVPLVGSHENVWINYSS